MCCFFTFFEFSRNVFFQFCDALFWDSDPRLYVELVRRITYPIQTVLVSGFMDVFLKFIFQPRLVTQGNYATQDDSGMCHLMPQWHLPEWREEDERALS